MIKRSVLFLSAAALSCGFIVTGTLFVASTFTPTSVAGTAYSLTLNNSNGKIKTTSNVETTKTAKTTSGADFTFKHKGLSSVNNAFAAFAAGGYLLTPHGVNGLTSVSATVTSGALYVSFAASDRLAENSAATKGDGDWTYRVELTESVSAPAGMHYVKIFAEEATTVQSITFDYDCSGVATNDTNIRVYVPTNTEHTNIWAWDDGVDQFENWPGPELSTTQDGLWKTCTFSNKSKMNVIFSHNDGKNKTSDLFVSGYGDHYYYNSAWYGYNPLDLEQPSSSSTSSSSSSSSSSSTPEVVTFPSTVYFTNSNSWSNVYAYAWNAQGPNHAWPGVAMDFFYDNQYGQQVYKIDGMSSYTSIIFTNGSEQTVDILGSELGDNNAYYLIEKNAQGKYTVGTWKEDGGAHLPSANQGLKILHCFDWSIPNITANIDAIADAGFTAVQTSPLQPLKDFSNGQFDKHTEWWRLYQPIGFSVAKTTKIDGYDKRENLLVNGDDELKALTAAAKAKGVRVIVDVVCNHLAGGGNDHRNLNPQIQNYEPDIWNGWQNTTHDNGGTKVSYDTAWNITQNNFGDCIDLNTSNATVQGRVLKYLKDLIDDGVTGFRFDAAKHIETKYDTNCGSDFWEKTLKAAKDYGASKGDSIFAYGEILNGNEAGRSYSQYINDAYFDAVTPNYTSKCWREGIDNGYGDSNYSSGIQDGSKNVAWAECHDDYASNNYNGESHGTSQSTINNAYVMLASRAGLHTLYYDRPDNTNAAMGTPSSSRVWACDYVKAANKFHGALRGASEWLGKSGKVSWNVRHGAGYGVAFINPGNSSAAINCANLENGTYKSVIGDNTITVSNHTYTAPANSWGFFVKQ